MFMSQFATMLRLTHCTYEWSRCCILFWCGKGCVKLPIGGKHMKRSTSTRAAHQLVAIRNLKWGKRLVVLSNVTRDETIGGRIYGPAPTNKIVGNVIYSSCINGQEITIYVVHVNEKMNAISGTSQTSSSLGIAVLDISEMQMGSPSLLEFGRNSRRTSNSFRTRLLKVSLGNTRPLWRSKVRPFCLWIEIY